MSLVLRLSSGSGRSAVLRQLLVVLGLAVATPMLLLATGIAALTQSDLGQAGAVACTYGDGGVERCFEQPGSNGSITLDYLVQPGLRKGVVLGIVLCVVPLLVFAAVSSRVAARQRDNRYAALRLAGADQSQVRRLAVLDALVGGVAGVVLGTLLFVVVRACVLASSTGQPAAIARGAVPPWWLGGAALLLLLVALAAGSALTLRAVQQGPLDVVRQRRPRTPRPWALLLLVVTLAVSVLGLEGGHVIGAGAFLAGTALVVIMLSLVAVGPWLTATVGRLVAGRAGSPALLLAGRRLEDDPWSQSRAMSTLVLATLSGALALGAYSDALAVTDSGDDFYTRGYAAAGLGIAFSLVVACAGLLVTTTECVLERRRTLAHAHAAGVQLTSLRRSVVLQVALPVLPATALAAVSGLVLSCAAFGTGTVLGHVGPWALALPLAAVAIAVLLTAASLPALRAVAGTEALRTP